MSIAFAIIFLMTLKPDLLGSLVTIGTAVVLGLAFSLPARNRNRDKMQEDQRL